MDYPKYLSTRGIYYPSELRIIPKHGDSLQPLYEAFTNSWEAIIDKYGIDNLNFGRIEIEFYVTELKNLSNEIEKSFVKIIVRDNGIGLDQNNFDRLETLRDPGKKHSNLGTGRVQYLHSFVRTEIQSVHKNETGSFEKVDVTLSKSPIFMQNKAILRIDNQCVSDEKDSFTILTFFDPIEETDEELFSTILAGHFKTFLIRHFLARFCDNRNKLPNIYIRRFINESKTEDLTIENQDIIPPDKEEDINICFSKMSGKTIVRTEKASSFHLRAFIDDERNLEKNMLTLVSKGELGMSLPITNLLEKETVEGKRFLFLLSGSYLDEMDSDERGNLKLVSQQDFKKKESDLTLFPEEVILKEDIVLETNTCIATLYDEIGKKEQEKQDKISELQEMFLLVPETVDAIRKKVQKSSSDAEILTLVYKSEVDKVAKQDANIKKQVEEIE